MKNKLNAIDKIICQTDRVIKMNLGLLRPIRTVAKDEYIDLAEGDKEASARLMRVNHTGEICAQGLYQGQAFSTRSPEIARIMKQAAREETDHLILCETRLHELGSRVSYLNPFFYLGSFLIGSIAGKFGDKVNLGLVAATEDGVANHLQSHLKKLPEADLRSREILLGMKEDEERHAETAVAAGAQQYPALIKDLMNWASNIMTKTTYWI